MDGLFCSLSFFVFVSVFCFPNNWKINADYPPAGGQCNFLFFGNSPRNAEVRRTQRTAELV
jgi:hypothetical protein